MPLSVVVWKWKNKVGWIDYTSEQVNRQYNQLKRFMGVPFNYYCATDDPVGLNKEIRVVDINSVSCGRPHYSDSGILLKPNYRRLRLFSREMKGYFGSRIMQLDLDMVVTGDISHIAKRTEPFIIWRSHSQGRYRNFALNTSLILMDTGAMEHVWLEFKKRKEFTAIAAKACGWVGSDQAVIAHLTYKNDSDPPTFGKQDGIYAFRDDPKECQGDELGQGVKLVSFHDRFNPADPVLRARCKWLARAWDESADHVPVLPLGQQVPVEARERLAADDRPEPVPAA